jgi:hypothetical protein
MKKFILLLFITLPSPLLAQSLFDKLENNDKIKSLVVNEKMFELMSKVKIDINDKEMQQYLSLLKKLDELKVYKTEDLKLVNEMKNTVVSYLKINPLDELMRMHNDGKNVKFYAKSSLNSSNVKELLMFIEGDTKNTTTVILSLKGDFNLDEIALLTDKMSIPGGEDLKKVTKK